MHHTPLPPKFLYLEFVSAKPPATNTKGKTLAACALAMGVLLGGGRGFALPPTGNQQGNSPGTSASASTPHPAFWRLGGNNPNPRAGFHSILGTLNQESLKIIAGNKQWLSISPTGRLTAGQDSLPSILEAIGRMELRDTASTLLWEMLPQQNALIISPTERGRVGFSQRFCSSIAIAPENRFTGDRVGIGTSTPHKKLHIFTDHTKPQCNTFYHDVPIGHLSHEGIRIENITYNADTSVWDIEPEWDTSLSLPFLGIGAPGSHTLRVYPATLKVSDTLSATYLFLQYPQNTQALHIHPAGLSDNTNFQRSQPAVVQVHTSDNNRWAMEIVNIGGRGKGLRIIGGYSHPNLPLLQVARYSDERPLFAVYADSVTYVRTLKATIHNFPDYVFSSSYRIMGLEEKKKFWEKYHRLPGFPSAEEARAGVNVNDLLAEMVREIEELNIRLYELWKENVELKEEITKLKEKCGD